MINITLAGFVYDFNDDIIDDKVITYQGYFYSTVSGSSDSKWSGIRTVESISGYWSINLGDDDWLEPDGNASAGDKLFVVFWENPTEEIATRTEIGIFNSIRCWFEIELDGSSVYVNDVQLLETNIDYDFSNDLIERPIIDYDYTFNYSGEIIPTWDFDGLTMSQEEEHFGENIFPVLFSMRGEFLFEPDDDLFIRTIQPTVQSYTYSFDTYGLRTFTKKIIWVSILGNLDSNIEIEPIYISVEPIIRKAGVFDLNIYEDRDFSMSFIIEDIYFDSWEFIAQVKETFESTTALADFVITKDIDNYTVTLSLDSDVTKNILSYKEVNLGFTKSSEKVVWDLKTTDSLNYTYNLIKGDCVVFKTVTRDV